MFGFIHSIILPTFQWFLEMLLLFALRLRAKSNGEAYRLDFQQYFQEYCKVYCCIRNRDDVIEGALLLRA
jgi:hypothetical protein